MRDAHEDWTSGSWIARGDWVEDEEGGFILSTRNSYRTDTQMKANACVASMAPQMLRIVETLHAYLSGPDDKDIQNRTFKGSDTDEERVIHLSKEMAESLIKCCEDIFEGVEAYNK